MTKYRNQLPQLSSSTFMTDGGLETDLIFNKGIDLPEFAAFDLLKSSDGKQTLKNYYQDYLVIAKKKCKGFVLEAPTYRANPDWVVKIGYSLDDLQIIHNTAIEVLEDLRNEFEDDNFKDFVMASGRENIFLYGKSGKESKLMGEFNKVNIGAAESLLRALGIKEEIIKNAFAKFAGVPGRMEEVLKSPFRVVVDYAHTPDSLEAVYKSLRESGRESMVNGQLYERKLICVLGSAGGGRDRWKRPKFGEIASNYCDEIILTDEDPFDEDPEKILEEIEVGILGSTNYKLQTTNFSKILDRREAIKKAISLAKEGDTIAITGKGSEPHIRIAGGKSIPWSDRKTVEEILKGK